MIATGTGTSWLTQLMGLNWRELVRGIADVLIVYYLIYRVLKLVRGDRKSVV